MVVVALIALIAAIATPSFSEARDDQIAFDYARQYQQLLVHARARAAGTGAAHLALLGPGVGGTRGGLDVYAALDGTTPAGPNPVSSCKFDPDQWTEALENPPLLTGTKARYIDGTNLNRPGVNEQMDLGAKYFFNDLSADVAYLAICITPSGVTYVGSGSDATSAVTDMRTVAPFNGFAEIQVQRKKGGKPLGLQRQVLISGGGAPRLRSQ